jgi:hypothetical protein
MEIMGARSYGPAKGFGTQACESKALACPRKHHAGGVT